jgi:YesN/AraC family two-component response regulator
MKARLTVKLRSLKNPGTFFSWLISYFAIIAVCITFSAVVYLQADYIVGDEINRANTTLIKQVQHSIDSRLQDIKTLSYQISTDANLQSMLYIKEPLTGNDWYSAKQVVGDFRMLKSANSFVDFFYISLSGINLFIGDDGTYSSDLVYSQFISSSGIAYDQWMSLHVKATAGEFIPLYKSSGSHSNKTVAYMQSLLFKDPVNRATLAVLFDETKLFDSIKNVNLENNSTVFIIDKNNNVISSSGRQVSGSISYSSLSKGTGMVYQEIGNQKMALTSIQSDENDWKYVTAISVSIYKEKVERMRLLTFISMFVCLVLSVLLALLFSRKHYNPVKKILNYVTQLTEKENKNSPVNTDDFNFIRDFIQGSQSEKMRYYKGWEKNNMEVRNNFFVRLLRGTVSNGLSLDEMVSNYDIRFVSSIFAVLLFSVEDYSLLFEDKDYDTVARVKFAVSNVAEEIANQKNNSYLVDCGDMLVCLINFKTDSVEENRSELNRIASECNTFFEEKLSIFVTISTSSVHKELSAIQAAYQEAIDAMEYRIILGSGIIINYSDTKPTQRKLSYSIETEHCMVNHIKAGDYDSAVLKLDEIFDANLSNEYMSFDMIRCSMFGLINTMIQVIDENKVIGDSKFLRSFRPVDRLLGCKTQNAMRMEIKNILKEICDYIGKVRELSHNDGQKESILAYVREHFKDPNLSISNIAEALNMSPISLSHNFKEQCGETLLDNINRRRLEKAKELMKQNMSIYAVATEVGYGNSDTFIRNFKKYEDMTPGKYKSL